MVHNYPAKPRIPLALLAEGHHSKYLRSAAREQGDAYFTAGISLEDAAPHLPKLPQGYFYSDHSGVLLKVRNVRPHTDDAVGMLEECWVGTVFGVLKSAKPCYLHVGDQYLKMDEGDWVMFDDQVLHSLQCEGQCLGVSFQVGTAKRDPSDVEPEHEALGAAA